MDGLLPILSTIFLGVFAGSLLTEGAILVPYWKGMSASEFFRLHHTLGPKLFRFFAPLTTATVALSLVNAAYYMGQSLAFNIAAGLCVLTLLIFFIYFKSANQSFADQTLDAGNLAAELTRWGVWHWGRTFLILLAFIASVLGHRLPA